MPRPIIPENSEARCAFFINWQLEFTAPIATALGFTAAEQSSITLETQWVIYSCQLANDAASFALACTTWRDRLLDNDTTVVPSGNPPPATLPAVPAGGPPSPGILDRFRGYIKRIKAVPAYTPALGQTLRILPAPPAPTADATAKPALVVRPEANFKTRLSWRRRDFDAVQLQRRAAGQAAWADLGTVLDTTYVDAHPTAQPGQPEVTDYRAIFKRGDATVGQWSDTVSATKQP